MAHLRTAAFEEFFSVVQQNRLFQVYTRYSLPFVMPDTLYISARGAQVVGCAITTVAIATFIVALRFITRSRLLKFVGREDWCIGIALVCNGHLNELHKNVLTGKKSFSPLEIPWV
jgi:hypothetical protein